MNRNDVVLLLRNIVDRIEPDSLTGKLKIDGVISEAEAAALQEAISIVSEGGVDAGGGEMSRLQHRLPARVKVDFSCLELSDLRGRNAALCLDFGTAMSKAFAVVGQTPLGLSLGAEAGYSESEFAVPSSVYISNDGKMFFGHEAVIRSDEEAGDRKSSRMRLDSPKQQLSQGEIGDLDGQLPDRQINPTDVRLSYSDLITLYLGYLSNLAARQLRRLGVERNLQRRIARPCWDEVRTAWADTALSKMCVSAQILADTFDDQWGGGQLEVATARKVLDEINEIVSGRVAPTWLQGVSIPEPVAAGFGRVFRGQPERRAFVVVDVGAGTTDFGLFALALMHSGDQPTVCIAKGSTSSLRQAGDRLDAILRLKLLAKHGVDTQAGEEGRLIGLDVNRQIRRWKETLFRQKTLSYRLSNDISGKLTLAEFEADELVEKFVETIVAELSIRLNTVDSSWITGMASRQPVQVVLTGGGSTMPMLERLAISTVKAHGLDVNLIKSRDFPDWIEREKPQFASAYRQLAVSIGGAAPDLPNRLRTFEKFHGGEPQGGWLLERFQVRGT